MEEQIFGAELLSSIFFFFFLEKKKPTKTQMCVCARLMSSHLSGYLFPVSPALPSNEKKKEAQLMRSNLRAERVLCRSNAPHLLTGLAVLSLRAAAGV